MKKIIFILIIFSFGIKGVKALNSKLEFIDGVRYTMSINDSTGTYYHAYSEPYIKIDGNLVYCLEPTRIIFDNLNYQEGSINLNQIVLDKVNLIGSYGYDYYNHKNYRYYLAAQELIWQVIRPSIDINWFNNDIKLDLNKEKEEIMYLVNNNLSKPYFDNQTFNVKENEELILEDDILALYEVDYNGYSGVRIEDNKLIINKRGNNNEEIILRKKIKYDSLQTKYYTLDNYQTLTLPRVVDEVISKVNLEVNYGNIVISKVDSERGMMLTYQYASLKGSKYNLYDSNMNLISEFIYDRDYYSINSLPFGTYYLKEIESSKGYLKDNNTYTIIIDSMSRNVNLVLQSEAIKAKLIIHNLYGDLRLKEDSTFMIYDMQVDVKDGLGEIVLKYGTYPVKQITTVNNHILSEEFMIEIRDTNDLEYTIINEEIKGSLTVISVDNLNNIIDNNFTYKIFSIDKNEYIKFNNSEYLSTNEGILNVPNLSYGNYAVEYDDSLPQYEPINIGTIVEINGDNNIDFKYQEAYESLDITVLDDLGEKVINSSFDLYCSEDIYFNKNKIYSKDQLIISLDMNDYNILVSDFIKGKYYIMQTKVADGYILNRDKHYIDTATNNKITIINNAKKEEIVNEEKTIKEELIEVPIISDSHTEEKILLEENNKEEQPKEVIVNNQKDKIIEEYIKVPNTGVRVFKINGLFALIIIIMGYIVVRYAKE